MEHVNNKVYLALFIFVFVFSILVNIFNINILKNSDNRYDYSLVHNSTIGSPDNAFYVPQIKNYLNGDGFTLNPKDPVMSVRRTPGYPLFYGIHYSIFGEENAHKIIPYTQSIIFALSAVVFGLTVVLITKSAIMGYLLTLLYGTSIFFVGYLFYTITEGIHPELVVFSLYYASKFFYDKKLFLYRNLVFSTIFCAMATLTRPVDGILLVTLILAILVNNKLDLYTRFKSISVVVLVFGLIFTPWVVHNYNKVGEFVFLEKYYQGRSGEGYGIKHDSLSSWMRAWGYPPPGDALLLHASIYSDINTNNQLSTIESFIEGAVPEHAYVGYSKDELYNALILYKDCINITVKKHSNRGSRPDSEFIKKDNNGVGFIDSMQTKLGKKPLECEVSVSEIFDKFSEKIKYGDPLRYYVIAPIFIRGSQYIFHSFTGAVSSLNPIDKKIDSVQYIIKLFFYITNVALWLFSIVYFFLKRRLDEKLFLGSFFLISFVFLINFIHVETRYMLAVYPSMYIMATIALMSFVKYFRSRPR